ncbi:hypothetical protein JOM56_014336 [Amanita muscaria]
MIQHVEGKCHQKGIPFSAKHARGRCMPHTIHLAAIILLEQSGIISSSDAKMASSQLVNYQESALEEIGEDGNEHTVLREDEDEDHIAGLIVENF